MIRRYDENEDTVPDDEPCPCLADHTRGEHGYDPDDDGPDPDDEDFDPNDNIGDRMATS